MKDEEGPASHFQVTTLVVHQGVLMRAPQKKRRSDLVLRRGYAGCRPQQNERVRSGSYDGEVRLWQMDPATKQFKCTHTLEESLPGP